MKLPTQSQPVQRQVSSTVAAAPGIQAQNLCVTATVQNGQVCVNLPIIGQECFGNLPSWLNGQSVSVCYVPPFSACLYYNNQEITCI
jgi:hypothetical protein